MLLIALWTSVLFLAEEPTPNTRSFLVQNVRIFDGVADLGTGDVLVLEGKIAAVGKVENAPQGIERHEGKGMTLLPGLIDAHTHVIFPPHLQRAIVFGVSTELDMFCSHAMARYIRSKQAQQPSADAADLFSAGTLVTAPGGHGTQFGLPIPTLEKPEDAQAFIEARVKEGSDYIKIVYEHAKPTLSLETLQAAITAAHQFEKLAVVHISTQKEALEALTSGADGIVHVFYDIAPDLESIRAMSAKKPFVIPALTVVESVCGVSGAASLQEDANFSGYLNEAEGSQLRSTFAVKTPRAERFAFAKQAVLHFKKEGATILAGTDAPNPGTTHGASMHRELELLVQAGLTPLEALTAATSAPADRFRLKDRGRIAPGLRADLVLVQGDPTKEIRASRAIVRVWKQGIAVSRVKNEVPVEVK